MLGRQPWTEMAGAHCFTLQGLKISSCSEVWGLEFETPPMNSFI